MNKIEDVLLYQIEQTSKLSKQYSQREFDRLGINITIEQWILLKIIGESTDLTQKELAMKSKRDPASITRTLDLLEKKEFILREAVQGNRRSYHIRLTSTGSTFIEQHMDVVLAQRKQSIKGLTQAELKQLSNLLERIQNNMA